MFRVAGAGHLAAEAVEAVGAETFGAAVPSEAVFAQTRAVGREAAGARGAVTSLSTVLPEAAHGALLTAPGHLVGVSLATQPAAAPGPPQATRTPGQHYSPVPCVSRSAATLPGEPVAEASVVTATFLGAVGSIGALGAGQGTDGALWG